MNRIEALMKTEQGYRVMFGPRHCEGKLMQMWKQADIGDHVIFVNDKEGTVMVKPRPLTLTVKTNTGTYNFSVRRLRAILKVL